MYWSPNWAIPAGRSVVAATPMAPSKAARSCGGSAVASINSSLFSPGGASTRRLATGICGKYRPITNATATAPTRPKPNVVSVLPKLIHSCVVSGLCPKAASPRPASTKAMPLMPVMPNPGITKISRMINTNPSTNSSSANMVIPWSQWAQKKSRKQIAAMMIGRVTPGIFSSSIRQMMPIITNRTRTVGSRRNVATSSSQSGVASCALFTP